MTIDTFTQIPPLAPDDARVPIAKAVVLGTEVISHVKPVQLTAPTPCAGFDVRGLLAHLVDVLRRVEALGRGGDPFGFAPALDSVTGDEWLRAWTDAVHDVQTAWTDDSTLSRIMRLPWAEGPGAEMLAMYTNEITVHTWDLARATGQQPQWDDGVLAIALAAMQDRLPAAGRIEEFEAVRAKLPDGGPGLTPAFAEVVPVPDGAPLIDRLVAWNGRQP